MNKIVEFPQRQHEEFSRLVLRAVENAALARKQRIEEYIQQIYFRDENPKEFKGKDLLEKLYKKYQSLIDNAVKTVDEASLMSNSNKAYLCFRIYLHGMTIERKVMSVADSKESLIKALREFFFARGKILSIKDEMNLVNSLSLATEQAVPLKF